MSFRKRIFCAVLLLCGLVVPSLAEAGCIPPEPINKSGATGSPFATKDVTRLDTQTSDAVNITGGCIDGVTIGGNTSAAAGNFSQITSGGPFTCDGYSASDGAITAGLKLFNSASAHFTAADVGKPISIREAAGNWFVSDATLNNGGSGHAVGDTVTLTGGMQIYVRAVSGGAITTFYVVESEDSASHPATLSQSATTGAGIGLVLNVTWLRQNLVTTVASVTDGQNVVLADAAAATVSAVLWGYGTDNQTRLSASLSAGIPIQLPTGICAHSGLLTFNDKAILRGYGIGLTSGKSPTALMYVGPHNSTGVQLSADSDLNAGAARISGAHIGGFEIDGLGALGKALFTRGVALSRYSPIKSTDHITVGVQRLASATQDNIMNDFEQVRCSENLTDLNTHCFWDGFPNSVDLGRDPDASHIGSLLASINTSGKGVGYICGAADHNRIDYLRVQGNSTQPGADHLGGNWSGGKGRCTDLEYGLSDAGLGGAFSRATGYTSGARVKSVWHDRANGGPAWVTEAGASSEVTDNYGRQEWMTLFKKNYADLPTHVDPDTGLMCPDGAEAFIGDSTVSDPGEIISVGGGTLDVFAKCRGGSWRVLPNTDQVTLRKQKPTLFANLPAGYVAGALALITDAPSATQGDTFTTGGGSNTVLAISTSTTQWRVIARIAGNYTLPAVAFDSERFVSKSDGKIGRVEDLKSFGAVCDGTTDDSAAFTAATAWLSTASNREVWLPAATCATSLPVVYGDGRQRSTTLTVAASGTSYSVATCTGVNAGDAFAIRRDDGTLFTGTVTTCVSTTLTGTVYSGGTASIGQAVYTGKISSYTGGGFRGLGGCWSGGTDGVSTIKYIGTASPTTTLSALAAATARTITVTSNTGISVGDAIGVTLNDASVFWTWVTETPIGATVKIGNEIPASGAPNGATVKLEGNPVARVNGPIYGPVFEGICLNANNTQAVGLDVRHARQGRFHDRGGVTVTGYTGVAHYIHSGEFYAGSPTGAGDNEYELHAFAPQNTKTMGCWIRGTPPIGPSPSTGGGVAMSRNRFYGGTCRPGGNDPRAAGILLEWADNNQFFSPYTNNNSSTGVYLQPSYNGTNFPGENKFFGGAILGGVTEGTATGGAVGSNRFPDFSIEDSELVPTGSVTLSGTTSAGLRFGFGTPADHFGGLALSRASNNQVTIAVGTATDSTGTKEMALRSSCSPSLATSGLLGLDASSSRTASTWYAVFLVGDNLTGQASCMMAQTTAAAVPALDLTGLTANWRWYAYVGRFKTDGSSNIATTSPILPRGVFYVDASDTYTPGASGFTPRAVRFLACGGGASGGSGGRQVSGTAISGGAGGSGGGCFDITYPYEALASTISATVGAGGASPAAASADNTAGNAGNAGNPTFFGASAAAAIAYGSGGCAGDGGRLNAASASGGGGAGQKNTSAGITLCTDGSAGTAGNAPTGGTTAIGAAGSATTGNGSTLYGTGGGGAGGPAAGTSAAGGFGGGPYSCAGGASGGGVTSGPAANNGGAGGGSIANGLARASGGTSGGAAGGAGTIGSVSLPGSAGGGGYGDNDASPGAGAGGAGGQCAGGGGGGSTLNTFTAGAGGKGGDGYGFVWELR